MLERAIEKDMITNAKSFSGTTMTYGTQCFCSTCAIQRLRLDIANCLADITNLLQQIFMDRATVSHHANIDNMTEDELQITLEGLQRLRETLQRQLDDISEAHFEYNTGASGGV